MRLAIHLHKDRSSYFPNLDGYHGQQHIVAIMIWQGVEGSELSCINVQGNELKSDAIAASFCTLKTRLSNFYLVF